MSRLGTTGAIAQAKAFSAFDIDAAAFFEAVSFTGDEMTSGEKSKFNTLFKRLKNEGVWEEIDELGIFYGRTGLDAALVKLKAFSSSPASLTNTAFVSGDYTPTGEGKGIATAGGKHLGTGISLLALDPEDFCWVSRNAYTASGTSGLIGSSYGAGGDTDRAYVFRGDNANAWGLGDTSGTIAPEGDGTLALKGSLNLARTYKDGVLDDSYAWNNLGLNAGTLYIGSAATVEGAGAKLKSYAVGRSPDQAVLHEILSEFEALF